MGRRAVEAAPLAVVFLFAMPRPKSYKKSVAYEWHPVKPDFDNLQKSALDALKGIVYTDDSQIVSARALKVTVPSGGKAALYVVFHRCGDAADEVTEFFDTYNRQEG
jgi:Holliday junction resolvase RusA-like endonuclease